MKKIYLLLIWTAFLGAQVSAQSDKTDKETQIEFLKGEWKIDLRPTPTSEAYYQSFVITEISENKFEGTFYGSTIKEGLINRYWDRLYFAFSTADSNTEYYHSGYLEDGKLVGISYCPGREFAAPWSGVKD